MKVLVVGGGGREHALAWRLAAEGCDVAAAPGNPGIAELAECLPIGVDGIEALVPAAAKFDLVVVGPEAPLVGGVGDRLREMGVLVFGPGASGARIEGSKTWARGLCDRHGIAQPWSRAFSEADAAIEFLDSYDGPFVVKADGLAAGKGVTVTPDRDSAKAAVRACLTEHAFGDAGSTVLIEECMTGPEISALAITDGVRVMPLALAQDHKRVGDGDTGPNTGGMGAYSPLPFLSDAQRESITADVLVPAVRGMAAEGIDYRGVLYAGLMLTQEGPKVLEFNCRFGDPETQALMPRVASGLSGTLAAAAAGDLGDAQLDWKPQACVSITLASDGYPGEYPTG
ncbi:MAG: phosphoribosylamine--glycine ligase, partial [Actinobacteria bacterium]|nr:phosphoribosylamine--glycine ligase [Actinomycetota bacterium]